MNKYIVWYFRIYWWNKWINENLPIFWKYSINVKEMRTIKTYPIFMTHLTSGSREGVCPNPHWTLKYHRNRPDPGTYILVYTSLPDPTSYSLEFRFMYKIAGYIYHDVYCSNILFIDLMTIFQSPPPTFFCTFYNHVNLSHLHFNVELGMQFECL